MPVITSGRTRSNTRWPSIFFVEVMANPLAFSRGTAQEGLAHPGTKALQQSYHRPGALCVTLSETAKKSAPTDRGAFHELCWKFSDYFPFLAAFLSTFFIFFAMMISFYRLLLQTVFGGTAAHLQSRPLLPFYG